MADVSAAAAAMGIPESLVERSVEARAAASGITVDDLLASWAGGEAVPSPNGEGAAVSDETAPDETDEAAPEVTPETEPEREESSPPEIVVDVPTELETKPAPAAPPPQRVAAGPYKPPVLVGAKDNPMMVLAAAIGLFTLIVVVGLVGPSIPFDEAGARTSHIDYSETALEGQQIFGSTGCASCHTQMVRPIVADVGLGPVTLDDTNQELGTRRFGPDLADVGSRLTASQIEATIGGLGSHPAHSLDSDALDQLVAYLVESASSPSEEQS